LAVAAALAIGSRSGTVADESVPLEGRILVISSVVAMAEDGTVIGPSLSLYIDADGDFVSAIVDEGTEVLGADGRSLAPNQLRPGERVHVDGAREQPDRLRASRVVRMGE
jgi:hypothetical protein